MASVKFRFKNQVQFNRELDEFAERAMPDAALAVQKKIAIDLFSGIIEKNPVGNPTLWKNPAPKGYVGGRSRANWAISITRPVGAGFGADKEPTEGSSTGAPIAGTQQVEGFAEMAKAKFGGTIWIFNNVRYIKRLEEGWSGQAPAGMVAITLAEISAGLGSA